MEKDPAEFSDGKSILDKKRYPANEELELSPTGYGMETVQIKPEKSEDKNPSSCGGL